MSKGFDWNEYLTLANELAQKKTEAGMRSAISRSYYCAYNIAKKYLKSKDPNLPSNDHTLFWRRLGEVSSKTSLQSYGDRIRMIRNKADYNDHLPQIENEMKVAMVNVTFILRDLPRK